MRYNILVKTYQQIVSFFGRSVAPQVAQKRAT